MTTYIVTLVADVRATLDVTADSEEEARNIALADVGSAEYEIDFTVESIEEDDES